MSKVLEYLNIAHDDLKIKERQEKRKQLKQEDINWVLNIRCEFHLKEGVNKNAIKELVKSLFAQGKTQSEVLERIKKYLNN